MASAVLTFVAVALPHVVPSTFVPVYWTISGANLNYTAHFVTPRIWGVSVTT